MKEIEHVTLLCELSPVKGPDRVTIIVGAKSTSGFWGLGPPAGERTDDIGPHPTPLRGPVTVNRHVY